MLPNNHPVFVGTIVVVGILSEAAIVVMMPPVRRAMLGRRAAILDQLEPTTIASLSIHLPAGVRYSRCLKTTEGHNEWIPGS
jgi:hypothetical protein